jgi:NNP family nitrate/nitrite transporter-like MFS transporter
MDLCRSPKVNPINNKARAIPIFNPVDKYGRTFFLAWWGFFIAFWGWYTFPPLVSSVSNRVGIADTILTDLDIQMSITIKKDLGLSPNEISNGNILALTSTYVQSIVKT